MNGEFLNLKLNGPGKVRGILNAYALLKTKREKRCYNEPIRRLKIVDMDTSNIKGITTTIEMNDGSLWTSTGGAFSQVTVDPSAFVPTEAQVQAAVDAGIIAAYTPKNA